MQHACIDCSKRLPCEHFTLRECFYSVFSSETEIVRRVKSSQIKGLCVFFRFPRELKEPAAEILEVMNCRFDLGLQGGL